MFVLLHLSVKIILEVLGDDNIETKLNILQYFRSNSVEITGICFCKTKKYVVEYGSFKWWCPNTQRGAVKYVVIVSKPIINVLSFRILLFAEHVTLEWSGQEHGAFRNAKKGCIYLTTHRVIFLNKTSNDEMQSFSFPFVTLSEVFFCCI